MRALALVLLVSACGAKEATEDYIRKSRQAEGRVKLHSLARSAKYAVESNGALPTGSIGPTPATPCCSTPEKKCPPNLAEWQQPLWQQLDIYQDLPSYFQYSYTSDGKTFTATASGDVSCDGHPLTLTITGKLDNGVLVVDDSQLGLSTKAATSGSR